MLQIGTHFTSFLRFLDHIIYFLTNYLANFAPHKFFGVNPTHIFISDV